MLLSVIMGCRLSCAGQGVIRVNVDIEREIFIIFVRSPCFDVLMYSCRWVAAMS